MQVIPMGSDCLQGGTRWDRINAILAQCKLPRTTYANINRRFLDSSGKLLPGISRDNLHFTEKGYAIWADAVLPYIKKYCK